MGTGMVVVYPVVVNICFINSVLVFLYHLNST